MQGFILSSRLREGVVALHLRTLKVVGLVVALLLSGLTLAKRADPSEVQFVLLPDAIPAISEPSFEAYGRADQRVMGVAVDGETKAYPIEVLNYHEIVNDEIGGEPVAVTYCPLCASGVAFDRRVEGNVLEFRVSGRLYKNNLVMQDTRTGSLWSQIEGRSIRGDYEGIELDVVPTTMTTMDIWREQHPNTTVLKPPGGRDYGSDPYGGYDRSDQVLYPSGPTPGPLEPKAMVLGVSVDGDDVAYPYATLASERVVQDRVGNRSIVVTYYAGATQVFLAGDRSFSWDHGPQMVDGDGGTWNMVTGVGPDDANLTRLDGLPTYWFSWADFHPDTTIYGTQVQAASSDGLDLNLFHPLTWVLLGVLAYAGFLLGRHALGWWRTRDGGLVTSDWVETRHGWVHAVLAGIVAAAVLYDALYTVQPRYWVPQTLLGVGLLGWAGALAWEWRAHRGRMLKSTNLHPEGIWWDCEDALSTADIPVHCREPEGTHPASVILELVERRQEIWVTPRGLVSVPADDEELREVVDASLARWANVEEPK